MVCLASLTTLATELLTLEEQHERATCCKQSPLLRKTRCGQYRPSCGVFVARGEAVQSQGSEG